MRGPGGRGGVPCAAVARWAHSPAAPLTDYSQLAAPHQASVVFQYEPEINDRFAIWQGDITTLEVDALVSSTDERLLGGDALSERVLLLAGPGMKEEIVTRGLECRTGEAVATPGFALRCRHVLHTVSPKYLPKYHTAAEGALTNCYRNVLCLAAEVGAKSLALCVINQPRRNFPPDVAAHVALQAWSRSVVVLFFKKGDKALLKNYRPISLLSHVYKLFSRVITNRLARRFDDFQPPEQAGFRKGYSTVDHIFTLRQIEQKTEEYNLPLCLAFVDYEKAFDSIETWAVLNALQRCHIDYRHIEVLKCLYRNATMSVRVEDQTTEAIPLQRGVRQGDVISPKLFIMEDVFKLLDWEELGININGEYISHLRFADDIVFMAESLEDLSKMLQDLNRVSQQVGLKMNMDKTKVSNSILEVVDN
ncbi:unnamed protein product [Plutella xylostella]|uniref:(diamondback moth) hypothetical protein n=1 Tax=Plutella xylostella TaxID=51655 RepID=A0A8S4G8I1_PLUXY|nr:unnamed protein product [Plutella xylostella]